MSLDAEAESWGLARTVGYDTAVQTCVLGLQGAEQNMKRTSNFHIR